MKNKNFYLIPGKGQNCDMPAFKKIAQEARDKGHKVIKCNINWTRTVISDNIQGFLDKYRQGDKHASICGFSFGAYIAIVVADAIKAKRLYLCSLSPYFAEDIPNIPVSRKNIVGHRRVDDFKKYKFNKIAKEIKAKTHIFVGEKEHQLTITRAAKAKKKIDKGHLHVIPKTKHDITSPNYLAILQAKIK